MLADLSERLFAPAMAVLILAAVPTLLWGWAAYTDHYGEAVEASYQGPCDLSATRRGPLTTVCDATLTDAEGGTRQGRVTDNLGAPLPAPPATVQARARGDRARTRMSGPERWAGLFAPRVAAVALLVVLATGIPAVADAIRSVRDSGTDADAVPTRRA